MSVSRILLRNGVSLLLLLLLLLCLAALAQAPGEIVFTAQPIVGGVAPSTHPGVFTPDQAIYAVATFSAPLQRLAITKQVTLSLKAFELSSSGEERFLDYYDIGLSGAAMAASSLVLELAPDPVSARSYCHPEWHFGTFGRKLDGPAAMCDILGGLAPGRHVLLLRLEQDCQPVASGKLVIEGADFSMFARKAETLRQNQSHK